MSTLKEPIVEIAQSVFETMLGLQIAPANPLWVPDPDSVIALVHLTGNWNGVVVLETSRRQACEFTGAYLSLPTPPDVDGDVRDVIGELANMIGGNLKSTMSPGAKLSPPSVLDGTAKQIVALTGAVERQAFSGLCGVFWVSRIPDTEARQPGGLPASGDPAARP